MNCNCCFADTLSKCETEIKVNAKLNPSTFYRWVITDKFGNKYEGEFETDSDGYFVIPVDELPPGLLTQYSGEFKLQVFDLYASCGPEKFIIAGEFDCISFEISGGNFVKNNLGCAVL